MDQYDKAVALWQRRKISTDAELAEALNGHSIAFAYHSGKIENERIKIGRASCRERVSSPV